MIFHKKPLILCSWCRRPAVFRGQGPTITTINDRMVAACIRRACQRKIAPFCNGGPAWNPHPPQG